MCMWCGNLICGSKSIASSVMQNELVLSKIASQLQFDDLRRVRSTCSKWNDACAPKIQGKHVPLILDTNGTNIQQGEDHNDIDRPRMVNMSEFINFLISPSRCSTMPLPFSSYSIPTPTRVNYKQLNELFSACDAHAHIKQLQVDDGRFIWENIPDPSSRFEYRPAKLDMDILRQIVFEWTPSLTEFEILVFEHNVLGNASDQEEEPAVVAVTRIVKDIPNLRRLNVLLEVTPSSGLIQFLLDVLAHAAGLKSVSLSGIRRDLLQIPSTICDSSPQLLSKVTCLGLPPLSDEDIRLLINLATKSDRDVGRRVDDRSTQSSLRLQEFEIQIDPYLIFDEDSKGDALLQEFLQTQATSLLKLKLNIVGICANDQELESRTPYFLLIPQLPLLCYFHRDRMGMGPILVGFGELNDMTMSNALPTLNRFEYSYSNIGAGTPFAVNGADVCTDDAARMLHPGVTELSLQVHFDDVAGVFAIASRFPGLSHLELKAKYTLMSQLSDLLWISWPELQSMTIHYDVGLSDPQLPTPKLELDEWLSGIPNSKHQLLRAELSALGSERISVERLRQLQAEHKTRPGLSDLCHLKKFDFRVEPLGVGKGTTYAITDIGGYFGLALANPDIQHMAIVDYVGTASDEKRDKNTPTSITISADANETSMGLSMEDCRTLINSAFSPIAVIKIDVQEHRLNSTG